MTPAPSRRQFLQSAATAGTALGLGEWAGLLPLTPLTANEAQATPEIVRFTDDIEPIVRLVETTPRAKCPEAMIGQLKAGLPYRQFLAAMFLAGLRNRALGGHQVAVLHSAHQLSLDVPVTERLLPAFWALDSFKAELDRRQPTPVLRAFSGRLPAADRAAEELDAAAEARDPDRAEREVVALARAHGANRAIEPLWRLGARDWVFIGHTAIWAANAWRTLQTVGANHTETTLRFLVREMIDNAAGEAKALHAANRDRANETLAKLPADWGQADADAGLTKELVGQLREAKGDEACRLALGRLRDGKARAGAVWDAVHVAAGELVLGTRPARTGRPDAVALHANTVAEALHFAFQASGEPATRLLLVLQAVGWTGLFRERVGGRYGQGLLKANETLLDLAPAAIGEQPAAVAEDILAERSSTSSEAVRKAFAFAERFPDSDALRRAAARLLPLKATPDAHDIKFPAAMFEKQAWVSPRWRPHLAAASAVSFLGSETPDSDLMKQLQDAVRKL